MKNKENAPIISKDQTKNILSQLDKNICKIYQTNGEMGTGFFCKIPYPDQFKLLPVLITNNHVLNEKDLQLFKSIRITMENDNIEKSLMIDAERIVLTNKKLDITIIEIKPFDGIIYFLDIDERILYNENYNELYKNEIIYLLQYPKGLKSSHSLGRMKDIADINISYYCSTDSGSSGSPVLCLSNYKVIGVHKQSTKFNFNQGTFIKYIIDEFNKSNSNTDIVNMKNMNISTNDILNNNVFGYTPEWLKMRLALHNHLFNNININHNLLESNNNQNTKSNIIELMLFNNEEIKDIYFLSKDGLKELNQSNTELYINDMKIDFKKHQIFSKSNFKIKIIIKIKITNCKNMFYNCQNLRSIDLSSFDTKDVTDMSGMFSNCYNLRSINLSSFNTQKVTNMNNMFSKCHLLSGLDLSSFDTKNVTDMSEMFNSSFTYIPNLINLNLSSFDTRNVTNMDHMFFGCDNLLNIIFSKSFNTQKVLNMSHMFYGCKNLKNLDLSMFDTRNVTDLSYMFYHCDQLENLNLSSFDTRKVTKMDAMFFCCENLVCLDLSSFNTKKVIKMNEMFDGCLNLVSLNIFCFDDTNVTDINGMFNCCYNLKEINLNEKLNVTRIKNELIKLMNNIQNIPKKYYNNIYFFK